MWLPHSECPHSRCHLHLPNSRPLAVPPTSLPPLPLVLLFLPSTQFQLKLTDCSCTHTLTDTVPHSHAFLYSHSWYIAFKLPALLKTFRLEINFIKFMFSFSHNFRKMSTKLTTIIVSLSLSLVVHSSVIKLRLKMFHNQWKLKIRMAQID